MTVRDSHLLMRIPQTQKKSSQGLEFLEFRSLHVAKNIGPIKTILLLNLRKPSDITSMFGTILTETYPIYFLLTEQSL